VVRSRVGGSRACCDVAPDEPTVTLVGRAMQSRLAVAVMDAAPVPLSLVRSWMLRDNHLENGRGSWQRLRDENEAARYTAVRATTEAYAGDGFVLDVGCSQGILQEGLRYRRYLGVDSYPDAIAKAHAKSDESTAFLCAEGTTYVAEQPPEAVVLNEVVYYLPDPVSTVQHYARQLTTGGVVIVSVYARSWSSRRVLRQLADGLQLVESRRVESGHLAWTIAVFRPRLAA
jgi:SAM-dependent methyltransferase